MGRTPAEQRAHNNRYLAARRRLYRVRPPLARYDELADDLTLRAVEERARCPQGPGCDIEQLMLNVAASIRRVRAELAAEHAAVDALGAADARP